LMREDDRREILELLWRDQPFHEREPARVK